MVVGIEVKMDTSQLTDLVNGTTTQLPRAVSEAGYEFLSSMARSMRSLLSRRGHIFSRNTMNSIRAKKLSNNRSQLTMNRSGMWLDGGQPTSYKRPKSVPLFSRSGRRRGIGRWALHSENSPWKGLPRRQTPKFIKVSTHPFIDESYSNTVMKIDAILVRHLNNVFKGR